MADPDAPLSVQTKDAGGIVRPLYQERAMKCYVVTDSELKSLSLANGLMVVFFSLASAFVGFGLDITKDLVMAPDLPTEAKALGEMARKICFGFALAFAIAGAWAYSWRRGAIKLIKKESGDDELDWSWLTRTFWRSNPPPA